MGGKRERSVKVRYELGSDTEWITGGESGKREVGGGYNGISLNKGHQEDKSK